jgi:hypothetical protein
MVAIATKKMITLSTAPCTTPFSMIMGDDRVFLIATLRVRLLMKLSANPSIIPLIFHVFNVFNIPLLQQASYALEMPMASMMCVFNIFSTSVAARFFSEPVLLLR